VTTADQKQVWSVSFQSVNLGNSMLSIVRPVAAQATNITKVITAEQALVIAKERFGNLKATGILGSKHTGPPIDLNHVEIVLAFLVGGECRKTATPRLHTFDLQRAISTSLNVVSTGAVICGAYALGYCVRSWMRTRTYVPGAMTNVNADDVERCAAELRTMCRVG
jgi:hypothetical protein